MKILFIDTVHPVLRERLEGMGMTCEENYTGSKEEVLEQLKNCHGLVLRSRIVLDREFLLHARHLHFVARSGSGLENIDLITAQEQDIAVINSPEGNRDAVAEQAIGMILMLFNNMKRADSEVRENIWKREENRGLELCGKTFGIIGYGVMGMALAKRLDGFGCRVIAHDKYKEHFSDPHVEEVSLEELKRESDIISLHLPGTTDTHHYINADFIDSCGKPFFLINTARGVHVSLDDLANGLQSGKVRGACLDVLELEKSSFEELGDKGQNPAWAYITEQDNVVLSPHVAGWTQESYVKLSSFLADKIERIYADQD